MSKVFNAAIMLSLVCSAASAQASDWYYIGTTGNGDSEIAFFIDNEMIGGSSYGPRKTWAYKISKKLSSDGVRKSKSLWSFNCSERTMTLLSYINIGNNDVNMGSGSIKSYEQESNYVVPDSIGDSQWRFVCATYPDAIRLNSVSPEQFAAGIFRLGND